MANIMVLKPKIRPFLIAIAALAVLVVILDLILTALFSQFYYEILVVGLAIIALLGVAALLQLYKKAYWTYEINDEDLVEKRGIVAFETEVMPYNKIQDISIERSFFGILFGMGDILIFTAGEADYEIAIIGVDIGEVNKAAEIIRSKMDEMPAQEKK
jgi:membrane protein YdbS with pleckstrin-like domain